jgi:hypothetical protein
VFEGGTLVGFESKPWVERRKVREGFELRFIFLHRHNSPPNQATVLAHNNNPQLVSDPKVDVLQFCHEIPIGLLTLVAGVVWQMLSLLFAALRLIVPLVPSHVSDCSLNSS